MLTHFVEIAPAPEPVRLSGFDDHQRNAFRALFRVGFCNNNNQIRVLSVGNKGLRAINDILVALFGGPRLDGLQVGTGSRLGHRNRADKLAGRHFGQPFAFLFFGPIGIEIMRADKRMHRIAKARHPAALHFLRQNGFMGVSSAAAAIFFRYRGA